MTSSKTAARWCSTSGKPSPAIFLDRDGVINERVIGGYVTSWREFRFLPSSLDALRDLSFLNLPVVVITNQQGIGKGLMSESDLAEIHERMVDAVSAHGGRIDAIYHCPHLRESDCECRKPKPGMLRRASLDLGIDLPQSWLVGDSWSDIAAGAASGCRTVLVGDDATSDPAEPSSLGVTPTERRAMLVDAVPLLVVHLSPFKGHVG